MKTARRSWKAHWWNVGRRAAELEWEIEKALTGRESIDELIRAGFEDRARRRWRDKEVRP